MYLIQRENGKKYGTKLRGKNIYVSEDVDHEIVPFIADPDIISNRDEDGNEEYFPVFNYKQVIESAIYDPKNLGKSFEDISTMALSRSGVDVKAKKPNVKAMKITSSAKKRKQRNK